MTTHDYHGGQPPLVCVSVGDVANPKRQALKIPWDSYEKIRELAAYAARHGWSAFGIDREDPPTQTAMIEEAIRALDARRKKSRKKKR